MSRHNSDDDVLGHSGDLNANEQARRSARLTTTAQNALPSAQSSAEDPQISSLLVASESGINRGATSTSSASVILEDAGKNQGVAVAAGARPTSIGVYSFSGGQPEDFDQSQQDYFRTVNDTFSPTVGNLSNIPKTLSDYLTSCLWHLQIDQQHEEYSEAAAFIEMVYKFRAENDGRVGLLGCDPKIFRLYTENRLFQQLMANSHANIFRLALSCDRLRDKLLLGPFRDTAFLALTNSSNEIIRECKFIMKNGKATPFDRTLELVTYLENRWQDLQKMATPPPSVSVQRNIALPPTQPNRRSEILSFQPPTPTADYAQEIRHLCKEYQVPSQKLVEFFCDHFPGRLTENQLRGVLSAPEHQWFLRQDWSAVCVNEYLQKVMDATTIVERQSMSPVLDTSPQALSRPLSPQVQMMPRSSGNKSYLAANANVVSDKYAITPKVGDPGVLLLSDSLSNLAQSRPAFAPSARATPPVSQVIVASLQDLSRRQFLKERESVQWRNQVARFGSSGCQMSIRLHGKLSGAKDEMLLDCFFNNVTPLADPSLFSKYMKQSKFEPFAFGPTITVAQRFENQRTLLALEEFFYATYPALWLYYQAQVAISQLSIRYEHHMQTRHSQTITPINVHALPTTLCVKEVMLMLVHRLTSPSQSDTALMIDQVDLHEQKDAEFLKVLRACMNAESGTRPPVIPLLTQPYSHQDALKRLLQSPQLFTCPADCDKSFLDTLATSVTTLLTAKQAWYILAWLGTPLSEQQQVEAMLNSNSGTLFSNVRTQTMHGGLYDVLRCTMRTDNSLPTADALVNSLFGQFFKANFACNIWEHQMKCAMRDFCLVAPPEEQQRILPALARGVRLLAITLATNVDTVHTNALLQQYVHNVSLAVFPTFEKWIVFSRKLIGCLQTEHSFVLVIQKHPFQIVNDPSALVSVTSAPILLTEAEQYARRNAMQLMSHGNPPPPQSKNSKLQPDLDNLSDLSTSSNSIGRGGGKGLKGSAKSQRDTSTTSEGGVLGQRLGGDGQQPDRGRQMSQEEVTRAVRAQQRGRSSSVEGRNSELQYRHLENQSTHGDGNRDRDHVSAHRNDNETTVIILEGVSKSKVIEALRGNYTGDSYSAGSLQKDTGEQCDAFRMRTEERNRLSNERGGRQYLRAEDGRGGNQFLRGDVGRGGSQNFPDEERRGGQQSFRTAEGRGGSQQYYDEEQHRSIIERVGSRDLERRFDGRNRGNSRDRRDNRERINVNSSDSQENDYIFDDQRRGANNSRGNGYHSDNQRRSSSREGRGQHFRTGGMAIDNNGERLRTGQSFDGQRRSTSQERHFNGPFSEGNLCGSRVNGFVTTLSGDDSYISDGQRGGGGQLSALQGRNHGQHNNISTRTLVQPSSSSRNFLVQDVNSTSPGFREVDHNGNARASALMASRHGDNAPVQMSVHGTTAYIASRTSDKIPVHTHHHALITQFFPLESEPLEVSLKGYGVDTSSTIRQILDDEDQQTFHNHHCLFAGGPVTNDDEDGDSIQIPFSVSDVRVHVGRKQWNTNMEFSLQSAAGDGAVVGEAKNDEDNQDSLSELVRQSQPLHVQIPAQINTNNRLQSDSSADSPFEVMIGDAMMDDELIYKFWDETEYKTRVALDQTGQDESFQLSGHSDRSYCCTPQTIYFDSAGECATDNRDFFERICSVSISLMTLDGTPMVMTEFGILKLPVQDDNGLEYTIQLPGYYSDRVNGTHVSWNALHIHGYRLQSVVGPVVTPTGQNLPLNTDRLKVPIFVPSGPFRLPDASTEVHAHILTLQSVYYAYAAQLNVLDGLPVFDSGASFSLSGDLSRFTDMQPYVVRINTANKDAAIYSKAIGLYHAWTGPKETPVHIAIPCLYSDQMAVTLISGPQMYHDGHRTVIDQKELGIKFTFSPIFCPLYCVGDLFVFPVHKLPIPLEYPQESSNSSPVQAFMMSIAKIHRLTSLIQQLHVRFGHCSVNILAKLPHVIHGLGKLPLGKPLYSIHCEACAAAKITKAPHPHAASGRARGPFSRIHADAMIMTVESVAGHHLLYLFVDDLTRYTVGFVNRTKSEIVDNVLRFLAFVKYLNAVEGKDYAVSAFRLDGDGTHSSRRLAEILNENGIYREQSAPYSSAQNGVAERAIRTIADLYRTNAYAANVPDHLWSYGVLHAIYVKNNLPTLEDINGNPCSPYQVVHGRKSSVRNFHPFGCLVFALLPRKLQHKYTGDWHTGARGIPGVNMGFGYWMGCKCYLVWVPKWQRLLATDSAIFVPDRYPFRPPGEELVVNLEFSTRFKTATESRAPYETPEGPVELLLYDMVNDRFGAEADAEVTAESILSFHGLPTNVLDGEPDPTPFFFSNRIDPDLVSPDQMTPEEAYTYEHNNSTDQADGTFHELSSVDAPEYMSPFDPQYCTMFRSTKVRKSFPTHDDVVSAPTISPMSATVLPISDSDRRSESSWDTQFVRTPLSRVQEATHEINDDSVLSDASTIVQGNVSSSDILTQDISMDQFSQGISQEDVVTPSVEDSSSSRLLDFTESLIPQLDVPLGVFGKDESVMYRLTTGDRTMVPECVINRRLRQLSPSQRLQRDLRPEDLFNDPVFQLGEKVLTRSRVRQLKKLWVHQNANGDMINSVALLAGVLGRNWHKTKVKIADSDSPRTWAQCMTSEHREQWIEAALSEKLNLMSHNTYTCVHPPPGATILNSKLIYKIKRNTSNEIVKFKVRLVVQGFQQEEGVNYFNTFSPTVSPTAIRIILALAAHYGYPLFALDISGAFLHAPIDHPEIYVRPPPGMEEPDGSVWILNKALYGLKQSPVLFSKELGKQLTAFGFVADPNESHVWRFWRPETGDEILLAHHVDDIILAASSVKIYEEFVLFLRERAKYSFGSEGPVNEYLKIQISQDLNAGIVEIRQTGYIEDLLRAHNWDTRVTTKEPMSPTQAKEFWKESPRLNETKHRTYRAIIGGLLWLSVWTRPDISFTVNMLSRVLQEPTEHHLSIAFHCLGYLNRTKMYGIKYSRDHSRVSDDHSNIPMLYGYTDAAHLDCKITCRSTSGYIMILCNGAVSWRSKRNQFVSLSTAESEFISASKCGQETCFLRMILDHLGCPQRRATVIYEDNEACIAMSQDPIHAQRTKHIDLRIMHIKELTKRQICILVPVRTQEQHADFLTKTLSLPVHEYHHLTTCGYRPMDSAADVLLT